MRASTILSAKRGSSPRALLPILREGPLRLPLRDGIGLFLKRLRCPLAIPLRFSLDTRYIYSLYVWMRIAWSHFGVRFSVNHARMRWPELPTDAIYKSTPQCVSRNRISSWGPLCVDWFKSTVKSKTHKDNAGYRESLPIVISEDHPGIWQLQERGHGTRTNGTQQWPRLYGCTRNEWSLLIIINLLFLPMVTIRLGTPRTTFQNWGILCGVRRRRCHEATQDSLAGSRGKAPGKFSRFFTCTMNQRYLRKTNSCNQWRQCETIKFEKSKITNSEHPFIFTLNKTQFFACGIRSPQICLRDSSHKFSKLLAQVVRGVQSCARNTLMVTIGFSLARSAGEMLPYKPWCINLRHSHRFKVMVTDSPPTLSQDVASVLKSSDS